MGATFTSFYFLCFYVCLLFLYYLVPKKVQWCVLLFSSIAYYLLSGNGILILYPLVSCLSAYIGTRMMGDEKGAGQSAKFGKNRENGGSQKSGENKISGSRRKAALVMVIVLQIGILFLLKYVNFGINTINGLSMLFGGQKDVITGFHFMVPLGISFYTFSILGYVIDVYNGIAVPQKNFFKLALYGMYFPVILSGPIIRYREDGEQFFGTHVFDYKQVTFGMQRMLWGFFKTLVISERMNLVVSTVYGSYEQFGGAYLWLATICFAFQLYTNFSGSMDIVLGMSQTFGLKMPENFQTPYFSKNISEYWRRWHITLGVWMKEYVFYPLLRTSAFTKLGKNMKQRFGKKRGKQLTTFLAMFILWFTVGIWHGGDWKYVIGSGLLHWFYIVMGELLMPFFQKFMEKCHINPKSRWVDGFRILRTFFLVNIGFVFFRADNVGMALSMLRSMFTSVHLGGILNGSLFMLGLDWIEMTIAAISLVILLVISILQEKGIKIRESISQRKLPVRWMIWYALLFYTILLGYYGPGYSAAEFIYQGF